MMKKHLTTVSTIQELENQTMLNESLFIYGIEHPYKATLKLRAYEFFYKERNNETIIDIPNIEMGEDI